VRAQFGEFAVDSSTRQLHRGGRELHLSPKAFDLLVTLISHRPAVVEKAVLRERLWPGTNVVDANLNNLAAEIRSVLGDDAQEPRYLRTAHGVGYAFCAAAHEDPPLAAGPPAHRSWSAGPPADGAAAGARQPRAWVTWNDHMFALDDPSMTIGRDPDCAIWIDAPGVSRRHAAIKRDAEPRAAGPSEFFIEDLGSTNGTFVAGRRLRAPAGLADGQTIQIGEATLTFRAPTPVDAPTKRIKRR